MNEAVRTMGSISELKESWLFDLCYAKHSTYTKGEKFIKWYKGHLEELRKDKVFFTYMKNFCSKNYNEFIYSIGIESLNLDKEEYRLFFELINREYKLSNLAILASILLTKQESRYFHYKRELGENLTDFKQIVKESIRYDIKHKKDLNLKHIRRYMGESGLKIKGFIWYNLDQMISDEYNKCKREWKLKKYASMVLNAENHMDVENAIRHEILADLITHDFDIDFDSSNYYIGLKDCKRESNKVDEYYKQHFGPLLVEIFKGCAKCGRLKMGENQLEYDHFWMPKSKCGNFVMRSKKGYYVNNCIPLCRSCNSSKQADSIFDFFDTEELYEIVNKSQSINAEINLKMKDFYDEDFPNRKI